MASIYRRSGMKRSALAKFPPLIFIAISSSAVFGSPPTEDFGIWKNPSDSVHIKIVSCGDARCGVVVWANEKAIADSRKGGTNELVGTMLLKNFREQSKGKWRGKAVVPDIGQEFSGLATIVDPNTITVKGCIILGVGCKSQIWTRISS
jgi:uncharacterized protein (DUF2147 family)